MQVLNPNNIKIYNLSAGKSLPEWLSDRKKRALQKKDGEVRKRIQLMQDFEMPTVSNCIRMSRDRQYIFTTGIYKPRVRCYDVAQMSMKFERCMDAEVIKFHILSDDYTKLVFMHSDRHIEFHTQGGRYYRMRIPMFGRDLAYHDAAADLYFVGTSSEVCRYSLERGQFLNTLKTNSADVNCCQFNPVHDLFACGTSEGHVECWDPRTRQRVGVLDCVLAATDDESDVAGIPGVTALKFKDHLNLAVGTSTGKVLLYDLRSSKPVVVKDHNFGLPIKNIEYQPSQNLVLSCDSRILKLWDEHTGKAFTYIEPPDTKINDLCVIPDSGLLFMANEAPKVLAYYIPALGPAPKWCSFLDSITEELEENDTQSVYDGYVFVTRTELDGLGLSDLIGTDLLQAYMHGYYIREQLYRTAKAKTDPFSYEEYRKKEVKKKIDQETENRVKIKKALPKVNRMLAEKLMEEQEEGATSTRGKKKKRGTSLLKDDRFATELFTNPDFQVDVESEEYRLLNPLVSRLDRERKKRQQREEERSEEERDDGPMEGVDDSDSSSDDEHVYTKEVKTKLKEASQARWEKERRERQNEVQTAKQKFELTPVAKPTGVQHLKQKSNKKALGERMREEEAIGVVEGGRGAAYGNLEMTFSLKKSYSSERRQREAKEHHEERRKLRRSANEIKTKLKPKFWNGKRVV